MAPPRFQARALKSLRGSTRRISARFRAQNLGREASPECGGAIPRPESGREFAPRILAVIGIQGESGIVNDPSEFPQFELFAVAPTTCRNIRVPRCVVFGRCVQAHGRSFVTTKAPLYYEGGDVRSMRVAIFNARIGVRFSCAHSVCECASQKIAMVLRWGRQQLSASVFGSAMWPRC